MSQVMEGCWDNQLWEMVDLVKNVHFQYQQAHMKQCRHCHLLKKQEECSPPMSLMSLWHDDSEKTPTDQDQRRSHLHFRFAHGCHLQYIRSGIWAVEVVYVWLFSWG